MTKVSATMHEANFLLHAISSMATADSSHLKQVVENIVQVMFLISSCSDY